MDLAKPAAMTVVLLFGMLICTDAWAQNPAKTESLADYAKLPICTLAPDGKSLAIEPCRTAPSKSPMPRRPVPQFIERMPQVKRAPPVAMPGMPASKSLESLTHPPGAPVPVTGCDSAGCYGANGVRYNNAPGGGVITPSGKTCSRAGGLVQC